MAIQNRKPVRQRRPSMAPREVMMSIDRAERIASFILTGLGGFFSLLLLYVIVFVGKQTSTVTAAKSHGICPALYKALPSPSTLCQKVTITTVTGLLYTLVLVAATSAALGLFAWKRKRTGVVFVSLFEGLMLWSAGIGIAYVFLGGWLLWRAYRLQKYGVATFAGASQISREQAQARKEGRTVSTPTPAAVAEAPAVVEGPRSPAPPSKRYTPKKTSKKR